MTRTALCTIALLASPAAGLAQTPSVVNGTLDTRAVTRPLEREFAAITAGLTGPAWIGYSVPARRQGGSSGCWWPNAPDGRAIGPVKLEGPDDLFVLYRIADRQVDLIRVSPADCPLDAGGLRLYWLTGVTPAASLDWLATFFSGASPRRLENMAITAIALHGDRSAEDRLIALARGSQSAGARSSALFWLSQRVGDRAAGTISDAIERDPDTQVKQQAVFALSRLPRDQGIPRLIELARTNRNAAVRRQAVFWLGQSRDPRALAFFEEVLRAPAR